MDAIKELAQLADSIRQASTALVDEDVDEMSSSSSSSSSRCSSTFLIVVTLDNVGAGKSTILNSLIGHPVLEAVNTKVTELAPQSQEDRVKIKSQVFNEYMYYAGNSSSYVVGYGFRVTRSKVFGLEGQLKESYYDSFGISSGEVGYVKAQLDVVVKQNDEIVS